MSNTAVKLPPMMTVADFLEWPGDGLGTRFELVDGELRAMAPGSDAHNTIIANVSLLIGNHVRRTRPDCRMVITPGVQPNLRADWNFRIPEIGVTCASSQAGLIMTPDPMLLVEVLSPSNSSDTWANVANYTTVSSVAEILIVHSTRVKAELLRRGADGGWPANPEQVTMGGTIRLDSIGVEWPIAEAYFGTYLAP